MKRGSQGLKLLATLLSMIVLLAFVAGMITGTLADPEESVPTGGISGFLWADGGSGGKTDGDGRYNGAERPLSGYTVYLYAAGELTNVLAVAHTNAGGKYGFNGLGPGSYMLGVFADAVNGRQYRLPLSITADNHFAAADADAEAAYTNAIWVGEGEDIRDIDGGMLPVVNKDPAKPEEGAQPNEPTGEAPGTLGPGETPEPAPPPQGAGPLGEISGFLWIDGNNTLLTDWDGLYNGAEQPLEGCVIYLYSADAPSTVIAVEQTDANGAYAFRGLEAGSYIAGVAASIVNGVEYLLPIAVTADSLFETARYSSPLMAFTAVMPLAAGGSIQNVNAGMRLPPVVPGTRPTRAVITLATLGNANANDSVTIDGFTWVVVRTNTSLTPGVKYVYLLMVGYIYGNQPFGSSPDYSTSSVRANMKQIMDDRRLPTIQAIAVVPSLGAHNNMNVQTSPTPTMAGNTTQDILFAPSNGDMQTWIGGGTSIPNGHPLYSSSAFSFPRRFYCRTAYDNVNVTGVNINANSLDWGIRADSAMYAVEVPGVWVNANAVNRDVHVYYVDTSGNPVGSPSSATYPVPLGNSFTLTSSDVPNIPGYVYTQWKKGLTGTPQSGSFPNPTLSAAEVTAGTDIYLIFAPIQLVGVPVGKVVTGRFINKLQAFSFTVTLVDASGAALTGTVPYTGGVIPGMGTTAPANGTLTLVSGSAAFSLMHGQTITLTGLPANAQIRVVETLNNSYNTSFTDAAGAGASGNDTGYRTVVNTANNQTRAFTFFNAQKVDPVPTGIARDLFGPVAMPVVAALLILAYCLAVKLMRRRLSAG